MLNPDDFSRRHAPPDLIRAMGQLAPSDSEPFASSVIPLLSHPEPDVRSEALSAVFVLWRLHEHREQAKRMMEADRHADVRARAAFAVAATSSEETRRADAQLLIQKLRLSHEDPEVRRATYVALLLIFRRSDFPDALEEFVPERDVDWPWIDELRSLFA